MIRPTEQRVIESTVEALERMADASDAATDQALNAARRQALERNSGAWSSSWPWAMAGAAVLALAIGIAFFGGNGEEGALLAQQPVADAELYQEMEFYLWLSEELEAE